MKLSTHVRYGMRLMMERAHRYGKGPVLLRSIADAENISEKYLSQIILPLKAARLVIAHRGAQGGYELSRIPLDITLYMIVSAFEGELVIVDCIAERDTCLKSTTCVTRRVWLKFRESMIDSLKSITLEDLMKECKEIESNTLFYDI